MRWRGEAWGRLGFRSRSPEVTAPRPAHEWTEAERVAWDSARPTAAVLRGVAAALYAGAVVASLIWISDDPEDYLPSSMPAGLDLVDMTATGSMVAAIPLALEAPLGAVLVGIVAIGAVLADPWMPPLSLTLAGCGLVASAAACVFNLRGRRRQTTLVRAQAGATTSLWNGHRPALDASISGAADVAVMLAVSVALGAWSWWTWADVDSYAFFTGSGAAAFAVLAVVTSADAVRVRIIRRQLVGTRQPVLSATAAAVTATDAQGAGHHPVTIVGSPSLGGLVIVVTAQPGRSGRATVVKVDPAQKADSQLPDWIRSGRSGDEPASDLLGEDAGRSARDSTTTEGHAAAPAPPGPAAFDMSTSSSLTMWAGTDPPAHDIPEPSPAGRVPDAAHAEETDNDPPVRALAACELAWLTGTREGKQLMGLTFAELALRGVINIDHHLVRLHPTPRADEGAPAVTSLARRIQRELDVGRREVLLRWVKEVLFDDEDAPSRTSIPWLGENEAEAAGGWDDWRRTLVARPLIELGLAVAEQGSPRSTPGTPLEGSPTPAGNRIVRKLGARISRLEPNELMSLARSQPRAALDEIDELGTAILLVPQLWPAVHTALELVPGGETRLSPAGLRLADLRQVVVP